MPAHPGHSLPHPSRSRRQTNNQEDDKGGIILSEVYDKRIPKEEDYEDYDDYEGAMEEWSGTTREDTIISDEVYEDIMNHYEYKHINSKSFVIGDKQYRVEVVYFYDGESPDERNTRILLVHEIS